MGNSTKTERVRGIWDKYKFAALVALLGVALLLWPSGVSRSKTVAASSGETAVPTSEATRREMEDILSRISGVGTVQVMLTAESDGERQLAQDTELSYSGSTASPEDYSRKAETVLTGGDETVVTRTLYPTYRGALVVCQGGGRAEVRLAVTEAVSALTGLTADRISVAECQ